MVKPTGGSAGAPLTNRPRRARPRSARGKAGTASSTFVERGYDPARALDGDLKTRWASDFAARDGWLAVDLGEEKEIGSV